MNAQAPPSYAFGRFQYDGVLGKLLFEGREVPLTPRERHLLGIFLSRPAEWLEEEWLSRGLWPNAVPPTGELDRLVRALTAALDEGADGVATIQRVTRRGYRLLIPVRPLVLPSSGSQKSGSADTPGDTAVESSGTRPAIPGGRSAHRALLSPGQVAAGLGILAAVVGTVVWMARSPSLAGEAASGRDARVADPVAMRAAAAAELRKGLEVASRFDLASRRAAITHFEAALQLDAGARNQAAAHGALAGVLVLEDEMERARLEAQAALAANIPLGPEAQLAKPLAALAFTQLFSGRDAVAARASAERALAIDAVHVGARRALVWVCMVEGRFDEALAQLAPAKLPGQFDPEVATDEAWILYLSSRPLEARQLLSSIVRRDPLFRRAHAALAALHLADRRLAAAEVELELLDALNAGATLDDERVSLRTSGSWALPDASEAARLLEERAAAADRVSSGGAGAGRAGGGMRGLGGGDGMGGSGMESARIYAQFGRNAQAIEALTRALASRESGAVLARVDPAFAPLRRSPAFRKLLDGAGVPALSPSSAPAAPAVSGSGGSAR